MMTFKLLPDYTNYQAFNLPMKDLVQALGRKIPPKKLMHFSKHNIELADAWEGVSGHFAPIEGVSGSPSIPDVSVWAKGTLVVSQNARDRLKAALAPHGEFLPVTTPEGPFWVFNCLTMVPADDDRSRRVEEQGQVLDVEALAFRDSDIGDNLVFKTDFDSCRSLFCTAALRDLLKDEGLRGLSFGDTLAGAF